MADTREDVITGCALGGLHDVWPGTCDVDVPDAPDGWFWALVCDADDCWMVLNRPVLSMPDGWDDSEVITQGIVANRASILSANAGLLGVM